MNAFRGSCLCGAVKFDVVGTLDRFYLCHCRYCQKDTGSAHAANLFVNAAQLTWLAGADSVAVFTLPGTRHTKSFCRQCGSALPNRQPGDVLVIPAGSLEAGVDLQPTAHIFTASRAAWDSGLETITAFDGLPNKGG